jgi:aryl-alcohol dehydrogenase-like predicted oxidoreductase
MKYKLLGNSGLRVSEICLGAMTFGEVWGWGASKEESKKMYDFFLDKGGNFIDTANKYTEGTSEKYLADFIAPDREKIVLATKYTLSSDPLNVNASGNHRKNMMQALEASLKRLNTEYIDLYWLHAWDFLTPVEEVMRALDDFISSGKVLYLGISDAPAWIVSRANTLSELRGWTQFIGLQIEYSLIERTVERELIPMSDYYSMSILAWSPLCRGILSGKFNRESLKEETRLQKDSPLLNERNLKIAEKVVQIADDTGYKSSQVALKWLLNKGDSIIPIVGARRVSQLEENLNCLNCELNNEQMKALDDISKIELGFPHDFLSNDFVRDLVYGEHKII